MLPSRADDMLRTGEVARMLRVDQSTVSRWRRLGRIAPDGLDEQGRPLYRRDTARDAERLVRDNGLRASGIDPRMQRGRREAA